MDEVKRHAALGGLINVGHKTRTERDPQVPISHGERIRIDIFAVIGNHHGNLLAARDEGRRQSADHVGESAGFREWRGLGSHHKNFHRLSFLFFLFLASLGQPL